ncbi:MAG: YqgE/AlgH family protein [Mangrovicoccus sp.]
MQSDIEEFNLTGRVLIAMPGIGDPRFEKSVIYICAHSEEGAMGLIINKPAPEVSFGDLLERLSITSEIDGGEPGIYFGGPVEHGRGFVLHTGEYQGSDSTLQIDKTYGMTATVDVLQDIAKGQGPAAAILALGYSGWAAGQLETEIQSNGWLIGDARQDLIFGADDGGKWGAALGDLGIDPFTLSAAAGRA